MLFSILGTVLMLVGAVANIIVLIKLFQTKGALHGILGIFCGIYTYIWGWMNATTLNLKKMMLIWTVSLIGGMICFSIGGAAIAKQAMEMQQQQMQEQGTTPTTVQP